MYRPALLFSLLICLFVVGCEEEDNSAQSALIRIRELERDKAELERRNLQLERTAEINRALKLELESAKHEKVSRETKAVSTHIERSDYEQLVADYDSLSAMLGPLSDLAESYAQRIRQKYVGTKYDELTLVSGRKFYAVVVQEMNPGSMSIKHKDGYSKINFGELSKPFQRQFLFRPAEIESVLGVIKMNPDHRADDEKKRQAAAHQKVSDQVQANYEAQREREKAVQEKRQRDELAVLEEDVVKLASQIKQLEQEKAREIKAMRGNNSKIKTSKADMEKVGRLQDDQIRRVRSTMLTKQARINALKSVLKN